MRMDPRTLLLAVLTAGGVFLLMRRAGASERAIDSPDSWTDVFYTPVPEDYTMPASEDYTMPAADVARYDPAALELSSSALGTLTTLEGFSETPYPDAGGWSIGFGHYMGSSPTIEHVTREEATEILREDVRTAERAVRAGVSSPLTQNEFDALTLLAYNIGSGAFAGSTLVKLLNAGDYAGAAAQFPRWNQSQGAVNEVLVSRRATEQALFMA